MATLDWNQTRTDGVTLVELMVTTETEREIRLDSALSPVWPPRRQGQPVTGWDGTTFTTVVAADERLVVGYASPAPPDGKPAELETAPPTETADRDGIDPHAVVRALGDARPPRDLLRESAPARRGTDASACQDHSRTSKPSAPAEHRPAGPRHTPTNDGPETPVSGEMASYFEAIEKRLAEATQLATVESSEQAREAVSAAGGIEAVEQLQTTLEADRERIAAINKRCQQLSEQLEETTIPADTLARLV